MLHKLKWFRKMLEAQARCLHHPNNQLDTHRLALLVLAPVQHGPVDLSGVPLGKEGRLALAIQELENL